MEKDKISRCQIGYKTSINLYWQRKHPLTFESDSYVIRTHVGYGYFPIEFTHLMLLSDFRLSRGVTRKKIVHGFLLYLNYAAHS